MRRAVGWRAAVPALLAVLASVSASVQAQGRPGPYVLDARGVTTSLSRKPGFYPPLPTAAVVPNRGFGIDAGGHVYFGSLGPARLGVGASVIRARATAPPVVQASSGVSTAEAGPRIVALFTAVEPQFSLNFGTGAGWSYVSGGVGMGQVSTRATAANGSETRMSSGWRQTINMGAGARWFMKPRLGVGFDIRLHRVLRGPITPQASSLAISAGVSVR